MPNKWHVSKEGRAGKTKRKHHGLLLFFKYLAFLKPAADQTAKKQISKRATWEVWKQSDQLLV
jgi:hypothetical protein